jgi:hypothetical protein
MRAELLGTAGNDPLLRSASARKKAQKSSQKYCPKFHVSSYSLSVPCHISLLSKKKWRNFYNQSGRTGRPQAKERMALYAYLPA